MTKLSRIGTDEEIPKNAVATKVCVLPLSFLTANATNARTKSAIADSVLRCLPEDGTNGFFVACFVRDEPSENGDETVIEAEAEDGTEKKDVLSHAQRQEAFKAKARAKGGKGGPKGSEVHPPKKEVAKAAPVQEHKKPVAGKKQAYLIEKALVQKRKADEKLREGGAKKKVKA